MGKMITWKDGSSYSRNDKKKIPNVWRASIGMLEIVVVYSHTYYPDQWIFSCEPFFKQEELGNITPDKAKTKATKLVTSALKDALARLK